jgi:hypothetical protein
VTKSPSLESRNRCGLSTDRTDYTNHVKRALISPDFVHHTVHSFQPAPSHLSSCSCRWTGPGWADSRISWPRSHLACRRCRRARCGVGEAHQRYLPSVQALGQVRRLLGQPRGRAAHPAGGRLPAAERGGWTAGSHGPAGLGTRRERGNLGPCTPPPAAVPGGARLVPRFPRSHRGHLPSCAGLRGRSASTAFTTLSPRSASPPAGGAARRPVWPGPVPW